MSGYFVSDENLIDARRHFAGTPVHSEQAHRASKQVGIQRRREADCSSFHQSRKLCLSCWQSCLESVIERCVEPAIDLINPVIIVIYEQGWQLRNISGIHSLPNSPHFDHA